MKKTALITSLFLSLLFWGCNEPYPTELTITSVKPTSVLTILQDESKELRLDISSMPGILSQNITTAVYQSNGSAVTGDILAASIVPFSGQPEEINVTVAVHADVAAPKGTYRIRITAANSKKTTTFDQTVQIQ